MKLSHNPANVAITLSLVARTAWHKLAAPIEKSSGKAQVFRLVQPSSSFSDCIGESISSRDREERKKPFDFECHLATRQPTNDIKGGSVTRRLNLL